MPQNLNALIRYKTIDRCLQNRFRPCTIAVMIENCSEALGEARGVYRTVSERTIRDDLRVMKSDSLGFEAPIKVKDGVYFYDDPEYSIFNMPIREKDALEKVFNLLIENRNVIGRTRVDYAIIEIGEIIGKAVPQQIIEEYQQDIGSRRFSFAIPSKEQREREVPKKTKEEINKEKIDSAIAFNKRAIKEHIQEVHEGRVSYQNKINELGIAWLYHWSRLKNILPG